VAARSHCLGALALPLRELVERTAVAPTTFHVFGSPAAYVSRASPAVGSAVRAAPAEITLRFTEVIEPSFISVKRLAALCMTRLSADLPPSPKNWAGSDAHRGERPRPVHRKSPRARIRARGEVARCVGHRWP
jgi:hypothetical protein